jgi:hypothetical protein
VVTGKAVTNVVMVRTYHIEALRPEGWVRVEAFKTAAPCTPLEALRLSIDRIRDIKHDPKSAAWRVVDPSGVILYWEGALPP